MSAHDCTIQKMLYKISLYKGGFMEQEKDTFEDALVDTITNQIMCDFDAQLREKISQIIKEKDPKALRNLIKNLSKMGC